MRDVAVAMDTYSIVILVLAFHTGWARKSIWMDALTLPMSAVRLLIIWQSRVVYCRVDCNSLCTEESTPKPGRARVGLMHAFLVDCMVC